MRDSFRERKPKFVTSVARYGDQGGNRSYDRPQMFHATCDECGRDCEVPFKPRGDKPVYCSNCFETKGGGTSSNFRGRDSGRRDFGRRDSDRERPEMHHAVCDECGKDCEVPFKPTGDKPVYCSDCFEKIQGTSRRPERGGFKRPERQDNRAADMSELFNKRFDALNVKLDKLIEALTPGVKKETPVKMEVEKVSPKKVTEKKVVEEKEVEKKDEAKKVIKKTAAKKKAIAKKKK
jgi:CxxC-x17-CxxC domain-containing protein